VLILSGHSGDVYSVAWSLDGKRLATGSSDKTAKVWDATPGKELLTLSGPSYSLNSVAWNPDGSRLATSGIMGST
jgi:WD40 repeat protein